MKKILIGLFCLLTISTKAQFKLPEIIVDTTKTSECKLKGHVKGELLFMYGSNMKPTMIERNDSVWVLYPTKEIRVYKCLRCGLDIPDHDLITKTLIYPKYGLRIKPTIK